MSGTTWNGSLDREIAAFVETCGRFSTPSTEMADIRRVYGDLCRHFDTPRPAGMTIADARLGEVAVRRYRPRDIGAGRLLYLHGGGWVVGDLDTHDAIVAELAERARVEAIAVDYRLAPEHVWPAAVDDSWAALRAFAAEARGPLVVAGDSAGGNLAAVSAVLARDHGLRLAGQVLIYPAIYADMTLPSRVEQAQAPMLTAADMLHYGKTYLGREPTEADLADHRLVPAAADLRDVAPAYISVAEYDPLRDDGPAFSATLRAAGVAAECVVEPGLVHAWLRARHHSRKAGAAFTRLVDAVLHFTAD